VPAVSSTGPQGPKGVVAQDVVDSDDASSNTGSDGDASTRGEGKEKASGAVRTSGPTVKAGGMRRKVRRK